MGLARGGVQGGHSAIHSAIHPPGIHGMDSGDFQIKKGTEIRWLALQRTSTLMNVITSQADTCPCPSPPCMTSRAAGLWQTPPSLTHVDLAVDPLCGRPLGALECGAARVQRPPVPR